MNTRKRILWLKSQYTSEPIPSAERLWDAAKVAVIPKAAMSPNADALDSNIQYVITDHAGELSWVFAVADRIFQESGLSTILNSSSLLSSMAAAVNTVLRFNPNATVLTVCRAAADELERYYDEIEAWNVKRFTKESA